MFRVGSIFAVFHHERKHFPRPYSEMRQTPDSIIGFITSLGYGAIALSYAYFIHTLKSTGLKNTPVNMSDIDEMTYEKAKLRTNFIVVYVETILNSGYGIMSLLILGKLAKNLINFITCRCGVGGAYTISPTNLAAWVKHAISVRNKESDIAKIHDLIRGINEREIGALSFIITAPFCISILENMHEFTSIFGEYFKKGLPPILVGMPLGFWLSSRVVNWIENNKFIDYEKYAPVRKFNFVTTLTLLGILFSTWLINKLEDLPSASEQTDTHHFFMGCISGLGGLISFLVGDYLFSAKERFQVRRKARTSTAAIMTELPLIDHEIESEEKKTAINVLEVEDSPPTHFASYGSSGRTQLFYGDAHPKILDQPEPRSPILPSRRSWCILM